MLKVYIKKQMEFRNRDLLSYNKIESPTYMVDGIRHYVVDHTPALFWKTTSESLSEQVAKYIDFFVEGSMLDNLVLAKSHIFENGKILDSRIKIFQGR